MSVPSNVIEPESMSDTRLRQSNRVVLPLPLGPISPTISPASTLMSTRFTAVNPPNRFTTPWASSKAVMAPSPSLPAGRSDPATVSRTR